MARRSISTPLRFDATSGRNSLQRFAAKAFLMRLRSRLVEVLPLDEDPLSWERNLRKLLFILPRLFLKLLQETPEPLLR